MGNDWIRVRAADWGFYGESERLRLSHFLEEASRNGCVTGKPPNRGSERDRGQKLVSDRRSLCYLCGRLIEGRPSSDHVPAKQVFPSEIRRRHNPQLLTLPTHTECNRSYQSDEDYFVASAGPLVHESYVGRALAWDAGRRLAREKMRQPGMRFGGGLTAKIMGEFEARPSGLYLPGGRVVKRFDGERVERVLWKIVRGLFFHEHGRFLPLDWPRLVWIEGPGEKPKDVLQPTLAEEGRGRYRAVFDYKLRSFPECDDMHVWAMLFWDKMIAGAAFHDPDCDCAKCGNARAESLDISNSS